MSRVRARLITKGILRGGAVCDGRELVIWLVPSITTAIHFPDSNRLIFEHCFDPKYIEQVRRIDEDESEA